MIRVLDLERSMKFYAEALNLSVSRRLDFPDFSLVYLRNDENDFEIELTWNKGRDTPYSHGDGYGHVAVVVDDIEAEHARLTAAGIQPAPIKQLGGAEKSHARFFFMQDPDGYKIEVLQRAGHYV